MIETNKFTVIEETYFSLDALNQTENDSHTDEQTALAQANATVSGPKRYTENRRFSLTPVIINNETNDERDGLLVEELLKEAAQALDAQAIRALAKLIDFNEQLKNEILPILAHHENAFNLDYRIQTWINNAQEELEKFVDKTRIEFKKYN